MPYTLPYRVFAVGILVQGLCLSGSLPNATCGERRAVLIGIDDYKDEGHLNFCTKDQSALKDRLQRAGFAPRHVRLLKDKSDDVALSPTKSNIESTVERICNEAKKGDLVLISFSGRGRQIANKTYICPKEGTLKNPETLIAANWIYEKLAGSQAGLRIVMLDSCRDADGPGQRDGGRAVASDLPDGVILLDTCSKGEVSIEDKQLGHGVYSYFLLEGLRGLADKDNNGQVTLGELTGFAERETQAHVEKEFARQQHPRVFPPDDVSLRAKSGLAISESGINRLDSFRGEFANALQPLISFINDHSDGPVTVEIGPVAAPSDEINFSSGIAGKLEERLRLAFHKRGITCVQDGKGDAEWVIDGSYTKASRDEPNVRLKLEVRRRSDDWVRDFNFVINSTADVCRIMGSTLTLPADSDGNSMKRQLALQDALENPTVQIEGSEVCASGKGEYTLEVRARSKGRKQFIPVVPRDSGGQAVISLKKDDEFELVLVNESDQEVAATVTIDGLSVFHFSELRDEATGGPRYNNYIMAPKKELRINGWHIKDKPPRNYRLFQVTQYGDLSGSQQQVRGNVGVITASFATAEPKDNLGKPDPRDLVTVPGDTTDVAVTPVERHIRPPHTFISLRYSR